MAAVDDLDPDRAGIDVFLAGPKKHAGMPGALGSPARIARCGRLPARCNAPIRRCLRCRAGRSRLPHPACRCSAAGSYRPGGLVAVAIVRRRDDVGSDRGIRGKSLHVRVGPGNGKGALTLQINTSRRERTRRHYKLKPGRRTATGVFQRQCVYYSFTLFSAQSGGRFWLAFWRSVCGAHHRPVST